MLGEIDMRFQRVPSTQGTDLQSDEGNGWGPITASQCASYPDLISMLEKHAPCHVAAGSKPLPFQPASYRDFMLFERHYIQAGRGFLRRFRPGAARVARAYESVLGRVFPPLKPSPLFYREPIYYMGNHMVFASDGADIKWPAYTKAIDFELELGFVLAKPLLNASPRDCLAAVGGFVVFNDFSARDVQHAEMASGFGPQKSKHFANVMSSVLVSADEILPYLMRLTGRVHINGRVVAECSSDSMIFTLGEALAHACRDEQLHAGEFFGSGTWPNGAGMETDHWLQIGDTVTVEIDRIGRVTNRIT
jgi:2-keto-4-pentenoate hydratase/2-oxohepta-3-ene-1,7-dioic acid hydratase in catechol pathway